MSKHNKKRSDVGLEKAMGRAMGQAIPRRSYKPHKSGVDCQICGQELWVGCIGGEWQQLDCLECTKQKQEEEWIAETIKEQAARSSSLYSKAAFNNFVTEAEYQVAGFEAARDFYEHVEKRTPTALLLYSHPIPGHSGYGTGKTHLASAISNALREDGWNILSWLAPDVFSQIKGTYGNDDAEQTEWEIVRMTTACDLLVFDDVGKEHIRDNNRSWHHDLYYRIINARYQCGPLIVTTNLDASDLPHHIGGAAFSRLWEMCERNKRIVEMCGPDYRFLKEGDQ